MKNRQFTIVITVFTFLSFISCGAFSQTNSDSVNKESRLHNTIKINASVDKVWSVPGDLSACNKWIPGFVSTKVEGSKRTCTTADNNVIIEEISDYSKKEKSFKYRHIQSPMPVKDSKGVFKVTKDGDGATVVWDASFEVADQKQKEQMTQMLNGYYIQTLQSLKKNIEEK